MLIDGVTRIPYLMNDIARHMRYAFDARTRSKGITRPQYRLLLAILRSPGCTQSELAEALDVERITLGRMIDRMGAAGLVERRADPQDRRVWRLHMLPAADVMIGQLTALAEEMTAEALVHLDQDEQDQLAGLLGKLHEGLRQSRAEKTKAAA